MTVFVTRAYFENSILNTEPNSAQHSVNTKPMNASSSANSVSSGHRP